MLWRFLKLPFWLLMVMLIGVAQGMKAAAKVGRKGY